MNNSKDYLEKGYYNHPQVSGYVSAKQFMLVRRNSKRCLLLRFENESALEFKSMEFMLIQRDANGGVIEKSKVKYNDMRIRPESIFSPPSGIAVSEDCVDFEIKMISLISGPYKYTFKKGRAVCRYDTRGYGEPKSARGESGEVSVRSQRRSNAKFYGFIAFIAFVMIFASVSYIAKRIEEKPAEEINELYTQTEKILYEI